MGRYGLALLSIKWRLLTIALDSVCRRRCSRSHGKGLSVIKEWVVRGRRAHHLLLHGTGRVLHR